MSRKVRTVLLTADGLRHRYVANRIAAHTDLTGIIHEAKGVIVDPSKLSEEDERVVKKHFAERDEAERLFFGGQQPALTDRLDVPHGTINSPEVLSWVREREPEFVLLYGSGIVKPPLLELYASRIVNMHLGLSPYYRGSGTNFFPLVNRQPECVGATIHLAVLKVDAGSILAQTRPPAAVTDRAHELGCKAIVAGVDAMVRALAAFAGGKLVPQPQDLSVGSAYKNKDFSADAVRKAWLNFDSGMMAEYLDDAARRLSKFPIVDLPLGGIR
ncbi:MAG: hypothetical protein HYV07_09470 [Deltaproteobacteria bacterium]|nr:hypothetical protein [Deltaproteobacteria bacterium]